MSHVWVTHMNESCHTYEGVMSQTKQSVWVHYLRAGMMDWRRRKRAYNRFVRKRALCIRKRALYVRKRALYICKRAQYVRKRALYVCKRALCI